MVFQCQSQFDDESQFTKKSPRNGVFEHPERPGVTHTLVTLVTPGGGPVGSAPQPAHPHR